METTETARPAHRDGGGPREFEQLGGQLEIRNSTLDSAPQTRADVSTLDRALRADAAAGTLEQGSGTRGQPTPRPSYATRLDAKPVAKAMTGTCRECSAKFTAQKTTKEFCNTDCRQEFNNRQMLRGKEIYSIAMDWRDSRDPAILTLLSRQLKQFKDEDTRAGRVSWNTAASVLRAKPYLAAVVVGTNVAGMRQRGRRK